MPDHNADIDRFADYEDYRDDQREASETHEVEHFTDSEEEREPTRCVECGQETASEEGLCMECQCLYHQHGAFDMDGQGWL